MQGVPGHFVVSGKVDFRSLSSNHSAPHCTEPHSLLVQTALPTQLLLFVCDAGDPLHNAGCAGPLCGQWEGGVQGTAAISRTDKGKEGLGGRGSVRAGAEQCGRGLIQCMQVKGED